MNKKKDILSVKTRAVLRDSLQAYKLTEIVNLFEHVGIERPNTIGGLISKNNAVNEFYKCFNFKDFNNLLPLIKIIEEHLELLEQRRSKEEFKELSKTLRNDGFNYVEGKLIFSAEPCKSLLKSIEQTADKKGFDYIKEQLIRMEESVESDPSLAIGTSKEIIETCCKTILQELGTEVNTKGDFSDFLGETRKQLKLLPEDIPESEKGYRYIRGVLSSLNCIASCINDLRNLYGTGHGKDGSFKGLSSRHAKLAVGASATLVKFLFDTHIENMKK